MPQLLASAFRGRVNRGLSAYATVSKSKANHPVWDSVIGDVSETQLRESFVLVRNGKCQEGTGWTKPLPVGVGQRIWTTDCFQLLDGVGSGNDLPPT
jgi:hypothetical protein